jgi:hypothetical protein
MLAFVLLSPPPPNKRQVALTKKSPLSTVLFFPRKPFLQNNPVNAELPANVLQNLRSTFLQKEDFRRGAPFIVAKLHRACIVSNEKFSSLRKNHAINKGSTHSGTLLKTQGKLVLQSLAKSSQ